MGIFRSRLFCFLPVAIIVLLSTTRSSFAQEKGAIHIQEQWRTFFSDQEVVLHLNIPSSESLSSNGIWTLSYNNRTLSQGTFVIHRSGQEEPKAEISFRVPSVKEGITIPAELTIQILNDDDQKNFLQFTEKVFIFPKDSFLTQKQLLADAKIGLFDPEQKTWPMFKQLDIPYEEYVNIDALAAFEGRLLIVGGGVDFNNVPALWEEISVLAKRGVPVLILAPQSGEFSIPVSGAAETRQLQKMILAREEMIREFDKNFDTSWAPQGRTAVIGLKPAAREGELLFMADGSQEGWPWLEFVFASPGTRIIVCGFDLVNAMESSPTPRYFLAELIQKMIQP